MVTREYYQKNREKICEQARTRYKISPEKHLQRQREVTPEKRRQRHLKRVYKITLEEWNEIFNSQECCCAVCKNSEPGGKYWHTDHCHKTNKVRGILCNRCNFGLGLFKDNPEFFKSALIYLQENI